MSRGTGPVAARPDSPAAWATAGLAFAAMFAAVGTGYAYGALLLPLTRDLRIGHGAASGVFSLTVAAFFLAGAPAGALTDRWGPRPVLGLGAAAVGGGLALTAAAQGPAWLYVGHGLLVGAGMSTTFVPLLAVVSASFDRHRSMAVAVAVSGIGIGTLVMAPLVAWLIGRLGWRPAYLVLAVAAAAVLLAAAVLVRPPPDRPSARGSAPVREVLATRDYRLLYLAQMLLAVALFMPFTHLPAYAESAGTAPVPAAGLVGVVGAASVVGRLALAPVADRVGALRTYRLCFLAVGLSFVPWLAWGGYPSLVAHAVVFGVGYGGFVALLPGVLAERFGLAGLGSLMGVLYTSNVLGAGIGPLGAGLLVEDHGYWPAGAAGLACGLAGTLLLTRVRRPGPARTGRTLDR